MTLAYIGIGSNLERPQVHVKRAMDELGELPQSTVAARSSLYRSAPIGYASQPDFINAVAALDTALAPRRLLQELERIEARHGRNRSFQNAPRTLDLDLLLFAGEEIQEDDLVVPHPRMHERAFVLKPLIEIAPDAQIPGRGSAARLLEACKDQRVERLPPGDNG